MPRNQGMTTLRRKRRTRNPMHAYDRLPEALRAWVAAAHLPWSARSVKQAYDKAYARTRNVEQALSHLDQIQNRLITLDAQRVWSADHPGAPPTPK